MSALRTMLSGGQVVAYYPALARAVGGIAPALFLQQIAHWESEDGDGWVFRTQEELEAELAMSPKVQGTCRKHLVDGEFIIEERRARNRLHYQIQWEKVEAALEDVGVSTRKRRKPTDTSGFSIYLMHSPAIGYKIGIASDVEKRRRTLSFNLDAEVQVIESSKRPDAEELEERLHARYQDKQVRDGSVGVEWFALVGEEVDKVRKEILRDLPSGETPVGRLSVSQPAGTESPNGSFSLKESKYKSNKESNNSVRGESENGSPVKPVPTGKYITTQLMDKVKEAKASGASIATPTDSERKTTGSMAKVAIESDGYELDTCLSALDYMVAKAAGQIEGEPKAWCGFRTALDRVDQGWRRGQRSIQRDDEPNPYKYLTNFTSVSQEEARRRAREILEDA